MFLPKISENTEMFYKINAYILIINILNKCAILHVFLVNFLSFFNYQKFVYSKISPYIWHRKINNNYKQTIKTIRL